MHNMCSAPYGTISRGMSPQCALLHVGSAMCSAAAPYGVQYFAVLAIWYHTPQSWRAICVPWGRIDAHHYSPFTKTVMRSVHHIVYFRDDHLHHSIYSLHDFLSTFPLSVFLYEICTLFIRRTLGFSGGPEAFD